MVLSFLQEELIEKKRSVLFSSLVKRFDFGAELTDGLQTFLKASQADVVVLSRTSELRPNGELVISLRKIVELPEALSDVFLIQPRDSMESASSVFKRESEATRAAMTASRPALWIPSYALVSSDCPERAIAVPVITPSVSVSGAKSAVGSKSAPSGMGAFVKPSASSAERKATVTAPVAAVYAPVRAAVKFQIPLDRLDPDHANEGAHDDDEPVEAAKENGAPEVAVTVSSESPVAKRPRVDAVESAISVESSSTSSPKFREVTIKKKVIVTEYAMGPNGEMIVKDVEKMVEETRMEPVVASRRPAPSSVASSKQSSAPTKQAKPGQATLTGFFRPKN